MRVLVVTHSERTHLLGLVPLAWALRARGDDVLVAVQPALATQANAAGLPVAAVGRDNQFWRVTRAQGRAGHLPTLGQGAEPLGPGAKPPWEALKDELHQALLWWWRLVNDPMIDDLIALCRRWRPDLVLWGAVTFAGALAAEACGARHARVLFGADLAGHLYTCFRRDRPPGETDDPLMSWLAAHGRRHGVEVTDSVAQGQATIDYLPASLRLPGLDTHSAGATGGPVLPMRYIPHNGRSVVPAWLQPPPERPRVCVTLGQSAFFTGDRDRATGSPAGIVPGGLRELLTGVADLDVDVIATVPGHLHQVLGPLPRRVRLETFIPLDALAATCSAVVNHGGGGTICTIARRAVPQLVVPGGYDEPVLGAAIERCGAGRVVSPGAATRERTRSLVSELLLEPGFRAGAHALQQEILDMPSPAELADTLARTWP